MLVQAARSAVKAQGRLQARYHKLGGRFGGPKNPAAVKKAILAIAHTLLKIAYQVLKSGKPYEDLGADFYARRESPEQRRAYLMRQLEKLSPGPVAPVHCCTGAPSGPRMHVILARGPRKPPGRFTSSP